MISPEGFTGAVVGLIFVVGMAFAFGAHTVESVQTGNCIKYHEQLSVVEANKTCNAILKGVK